MAQDVTPIERLQEQPITVDPARIEDEFTRIWRETSGAGYDESSIRMRVLNLVALAGTEHDIDRFERVMAVLAQRHPCRGMLARTAEGVRAPEATISAHCWRSEGGGRHVCSEEVLLAGSPVQEPELASAVLALLVPELPVATWFIGTADRTGYLATELLTASDLVIVDSSDRDDPADIYPWLLSVERRVGAACTDLAWGRLAAWRALTAQLFDGEDGARELDQIASIAIKGGKATPSSEALLLAGWLTSRLELPLADNRRQANSITATMYDGTRGVSVSIAPAETGAALQELLIRTADAQFALQCHAESGHIHVRENWAVGSTRRTVEQDPLDDAAVIAAVLDGGSDGPVLRASIEAALGLLGG